MNLGTLGTHGATALLSCAAASLVNAPEPAVAPSSLPATARTLQHGRSSTEIDRSPLIAVSSDGNVTLRVEQQPLEWVLAQIAEQSGWTDVKQRASATTSPAMAVAAAPAHTMCAEGIVTPDAAPSCAQAQNVTNARLEQLQQKLKHGTEIDRYNALLQARSEGGALPDEMLKQLFETDASNRVRLLAFESYLEPRGGSADAMRSALEAALQVPNGAIQREARLQLDQLLDGERIDTVTVQQADP